MTSTALGGNMKFRRFVFASVALVAAVSWATTVSKATRTTVAADVLYDVLTDRYATYPIATQPVFALDCSRTNGWTIVKDGSNRRVTRLPDVGGGTRYLTSNLDEISHDQYGTSTLWYNRWKEINGPRIYTSDGVVKGCYLDFGACQSSWCLFFNTADGDTRKNRLSSVGTVIGVYKPSNQLAGWVTSTEAAGGQILGGNDFQRHSAYNDDSRGMKRAEPMVYKTSAAGSLGGRIWKGLQRNDMTYTYWATGWQVIAFNPKTATLETYGVGVGNCEHADFSQSNGGQAIAELMIFNTVLSDDDVAKVVKYLSQKWLPDTLDGVAGAGRMSSLTVQDNGENPTAGHTVSVDVPAGETLTIDSLRGGRGSTAQRLVKTGAGALSLNGAQDFGGEVCLEGGRLVHAAKEVPTFAQLPKDMTIHLDPSVADGMQVAEGRVTQWDNGLWSVRNVSARPDAGKNGPRLEEDVLGEGLDVLDFGSATDGTATYMAWEGTPKFATVVAVVDVRIQAGGHLLEGPFARAGYTPMARWTNFGAKFFDTSDTKAVANAWVDGIWMPGTDADFGSPTWHVVAYRVPATESSVKYLGAHAWGSNSFDAGGFRLGEFIAYDRSLGDEEVRDVMAYLMQRWLGQTAPGYARAKTGLADLQNVSASEGVEIDVPAGRTMTIAKLSSSGGAAVKVGGGRLVLGPGSNLAGGLTVREGTVAMGEADAGSSSELAADPFLHLDAAASCSHFDVLENGTNFVAAWESLSGRSGTYTSFGQDRTRWPFVNANADDLLNGLPVIDFGEQYGWANKGRFLSVSPESQNARAIYVVYGSQAKGGQIFGAYNTVKFRDFKRPSGGSAPALDTPLFAGAADAVANGEIYTNGVRIATEDNRKVAPTGGYQLIEVHTTAGLRFSALGTSYGEHFIYGGLRLGEVIVYEHPLSEREKAATRNYLLRKWFPDSPLSELPPKEIVPAEGSIAFASGTTWDVSVGASGVLSGALGVTGTLSFATGATLRLTGLGSVGDLTKCKLLVAMAGNYEGLDNLAIAGDVAFTDATRPRLSALPNGKLYVKFGPRPGALILLR